MSEESLKSCPFCGSDDVNEDWSNVCEGTIDVQWGEVLCESCGGGMGIELRGDEVYKTGKNSGSSRLIDKWNKRA